MTRSVPPDADPKRSEMKRCVIYARVSTDAQERDGTSLETQERECRQYADVRGWMVVDSFRDSATGSTLDRPGIHSVREAMSAGRCDLVIAYAVDRLSRNQNHIGILLDEAERCDVALGFVTEEFENTAVGRFVLAARALSAEIEREKISERTMRGKAERARSGRLPQGTGYGMYGYRYDPASGRRTVHEAEAAIVRRVFERYLDTQSFSAISNELNDAGVPAFRHGPWYPLTIRRMLANETYTGRTLYRRTRRTRVRGHSSVVLRPDVNTA